MISSALVFSLALTAAPADDMRSARQAYSACLERFMAQRLDEKMEDLAFDTAIAGACSPEAARLRQTAIDASVASGRKRADAEEMVAGDIEDYQLNTKELFREYKKSGASPST